MEDLEEFYQLYGSPGMEFIEPLEDYETEQEKLWSYIHNRYPFYGYGMWTVEDKKTGKVIGRAGLEEREIDGVEYTEIGYMLHHLYRKNGIGYEICQAILEYAKNTLYIEEIHAVTHLDNVVSMQVLEHLGFEGGGVTECDGERRQHYKKVLTNC